MLPVFPLHFRSPLADRKDASVHDTSGRLASPLLVLSRSRPASSPASNWISPWTVEIWISSQNRLGRVSSTSAEARPRRKKKEELAVSPWRTERTPSSLMRTSR